MKKLAIIALALTASAAFADRGGDRPSTPSPAPAASGPVSNDPSVQATVLLNTAVINAAGGYGSEAVQNIATNAGKVTVNDSQLQLVGAKSSLIMNAALGGEARQNLA